MTKHRRTRVKKTRVKRTKTRRRTQKGGYGESIIEPVKRTSISVINAAENGLTKVTDVIGNAATSIKNYFSNTSSTNYVGGKRRRRRR
jgi:hypothetical protein